MTKREICDERPTFAYYSGLGCLEARFIEYGINDYLYLIAGQWSGRKTYHKLKIHYGGSTITLPCTVAVAAFRTL